MVTKEVHDLRVPASITHASFLSPINLHVGIVFRASRLAALYLTALTAKTNIGARPPLLLSPLPMEYPATNTHPRFSPQKQRGRKRNAQEVFPMC